ncbi:Tyrosine-protein phosphatase non-receptor type 2 [Merluccius polli]|uniref:Tyrosine-protein phosphatase non-receptor type n=1 Tax=Merluccius polli TaxID=89951 RepID=A0AA47MHQ2_MERPO|nr:Tyrosine-protein phosphatase non-receptor type 2 [Merluccius polli]
MSENGWVQSWPRIEVLIRRGEHNNPLRGRRLTGVVTSEMDQEFEDMDSDDRWQNLYIEIRSQSHDCPYKIAKYPENRNRNRYRDVNPFDHSRVKLGSAENDYINASLVGPLKNTCSHFWMMVWEQRTKAVIMLNRVMEKGSEKCAQYWPPAKEQDMAFRDTGFLVTLLSEDVKSYYTTRVLELQNVHTGEKREVYHFHYTTWPDFGVPDSPASFLNFLFKVRESTSLGADHGPAVVHCSAGIGRSGTFSLVDTCLVLMDKRKDPSSVDIKSILLDMRKYRMGLIQTPDQLRFSYMAVLEGAKFIMGDSSVQKRWRELSKEDQAPAPDSPPLPQPQDYCRLARLNGGLRGPPQPEGAGDGGPETDKTPALAPCKEADVDSSSTPKRRREDSLSKSPAARTPQQQQQSRTNDSEKKRKR